MTRQQVATYLSLLNDSGGHPSLEALKNLVRAQVTKVPFENISKLYRWKLSGTPEIPDLDTYLDGIDRCHFGGTCYSNNYYFYRLLCELGYEAMLCGADMRKPDVHVVSLVRLEGREYIVDAGFAAPFLEPLPRDLPAPYTVSLGTDRYVLSPKDAAGHSLLALHREGNTSQGYRINPTPRSIEEFRQVIADSYHPDSEFMKSVLLVKFGANRSTVVRNLMLVRNEGTSYRKTPLASTEELINAIQDEFSIPPAISRLALENMSF